jgi:hypothetical protein
MGRSGLIARVRSRLAGAFALSALLGACSDVTTVLAARDAAMPAPPPPTDAGQAPPPPGDAARDASIPETAMCGKKACACDDGEDDDGDGLFDGFDPECTGPFDDDEASFATGKMPGPPMGPACRGCFWNPKPGKAGDDCRYAAECLEGRAPPAPVMMGPEACTCEVSDTCKDTCLERTPNGCDCFGCCEVTRDDGSRVQVVLGERCSLAKIDDPAACPPCVPSAACRNDCGTCELCPGRTRDELPALCTGGASSEEAPQNACDEGNPVCGPDQACPHDYYCQLGCCLYVLP